MKNKLFVVFIFFFGLLVFSPSIQAQKKTTVSYKTVTVKGKKYYKHHVTKGETLIGIAKAYKVSVEELTRLNPSVEKGLQAEQYLIVPIKVKPKPKPEPEAKPKTEPKADTVPLPKEEPKLESGSKEEPKPEPGLKQDEVAAKEKEEEQIKEPGNVVEDEFNTVQVKAINPENTPKIRFDDKDYYLHDVKAGETLEQISEAYQISADEIMLYNPDLKNGMKVGMVLGIPVGGSKDSKDEKGDGNINQDKKEESENTPKNSVNEAVPEVRTETPKVTPTPKPGTNTTKPSPGGYYTVQPKEDLYDIAKKFGVDIADLKAINEGLSNNPKSGTVIEIPKIANENDYIVHYCERNERVTSLLKRWKVDESAFRAKNISVGSHVFENQVVLIPIQPITDFYWMDEEQEAVVVEKIQEEGIGEEVEAPKPPVDLPQLDFDFEANDIPVCVANPANAQKRYHVALMVPLYLYDIDNLSISKERSKKTQKSRSMSFLQFYEGFMIAAETLEKQGLKLDLTVMDVTDNVSSAERALEQIRGKDFDLIVGPFFGRSFDVIEEYAKANGIVMVNPLSTRESVIENSPNVVKVKPGDIGMILSISSLVKNSYSNANVFIVSREKAADTVFLNQLEHHLNLAVNEEVTVSGDEFLNFARDESERLEMGSRLVPTLDVEGQVYSTDDFQNGSMDKVVMSNSVRRYSYSEMGTLKSHLSGVRPNLIIAYGDDNVFATQILNALTKSADRFPITLVCVSDWQKHEKLLVDNLLKMNAIYVSDFFVDYQDEDVKRFVRRFRSKYVTEPQNYAFEGYDVGYYFLNGLMQYGNEDLIGCLHCYEASLLHTHYRFYYKNYLKSGEEYGKENLYWSLYQYDKENIELVPIDPFKKISDHE
jgi:LysM repeat protein/ABC-type branched-subunit amino acid transport system substrate-binding protein